MLQVDSNGDVFVTNAHLRLAGTRKSMGGSANGWEYEFESYSQTEHKLLLKVVDGQLVMRRWTGTDWVASAIVERTTSITKDETTLPLSPSSSAVPVLIFVVVAFVALAACPFVCYMCRKWLKGAPETIVENAVAHGETPPMLLRRENSEKKEKTAEFGTSQPSSNDVGVGNADVELELGLGGQDLYTLGKKYSASFSFISEDDLPNIGALEEDLPSL